MPNSDFAASEASISVAFGKAHSHTAGKNAILLAGSVQIASASGTSSSNDIKKSDARIRRQRARKRRIANITIQQNNTCPTLRDERRHRRSEGGFALAC